MPQSLVEVFLFSLLIDLTGAPVLGPTLTVDGIDLLLVLTGLLTSAANSFFWIWGGSRSGVDFCSTRSAPRSLAVAALMTGHWLQRPRLVHSLLDWDPPG